MYEMTKRTATGEHLQDCCVYHGFIAKLYRATAELSRALAFFKNYLSSCIAYSAGPCLGMITMDKEKRLNIKALAANTRSL